MKNGLNRTQIRRVIKKALWEQFSHSILRLVFIYFLKIAIHAITEFKKGDFQFIHYKNHYLRLLTDFLNDFYIGKGILPRSSHYNHVSI